MSMRITFLKDHDGHKINKDCFIERTLACRLCENGIALPYSTYIESIKAAKETALKEKAIADAEERKKAELIKKREDAKNIETAISKKAKKREKTKTKFD